MDRGGDGIRTFPSRSVRRYVRTQAVACGHCVQNFLADLDLRDLSGEAAGFELGADDTLPTADLRFYPAALVVPCGHVPGHAAVAADLGNMAIPNGWDPSGIISTVAGTGEPGFTAEGVPAIQAQLAGPTAVTVDGAGNIYFASRGNYIADRGNDRIHTLKPAGCSALRSNPPPPVSAQAFFIPERGGVSFASQDTSPVTLVDMDRWKPDDGMTLPAGLAIFAFRQNGILVSEASVPASAAVREGQIFVEIDGAVTTGIAIANPNDSGASIRAVFTDSHGIDYVYSGLWLGPRQQMARFLPESFWQGIEGLGTFTFTSDIPIAVIALRGFVNERSEFLMTTLPVVPLTDSTADTVYFPHFANGAGWTTQVVLVNPTQALIRGMVQFRRPGSETAVAGAATLTLADGRSGSEFAYSIPPRSVTRFQTSNPTGNLQIGSIRVAADSGDPAPSGVSVFSFQSGGVTVSEAGVPASAPGTTFRVYVEAIGAIGQPQSVRSGIALTQHSGDGDGGFLELIGLDGSAAGLTESLTIPASGQVARFIDEIFLR